MTEKSENKVKPFPVLNTKRFLLREVELNDAPVISKLRSDPEVNRHISRPKVCDMDSAVAHIKKIQLGIRNGVSLYWAISPQENKDLIGTICLWNFSEDKKVAEVGYELFPAWHGKGVMREVLERVVSFAKENDMHAVEAFTQNENQKSIRLLQACSFVLQPDRKDPGVPQNLIFVREL